MANNTFFNSRLWNQQMTEIAKNIEKINIRDKQFIVNNFNFLFFVAFLALCYIFNARNAENKIRQINQLSKSIKEQRWLFITKQSELMIKSRQKNVVELVNGMGLQNLRLPPPKIAVPPVE